MHQDALLSDLVLGMEFIEWVQGMEFNFHALLKRTASIHVAPAQAACAR